MLSGNEIAKQVQNGSIVIRPYFADQMNPNSYNLCLGKTLLVYKIPSWWERLWLWLKGTPWCLDMKKDNPVEEITIPEQGYQLRPGFLYLASTAEYTETHGYVPVIEGRSSVGRLGLCIHVTAGFGDCGFKGHWTLEITVVHPVRIYAGVEICQIAYDEVEGEPATPYEGKYQHQDGKPKPSGMWRDFLKKRMRHHAAGKQEAEETGSP